MNDLMTICEALKAEKITYEQAKEFMAQFSKEGLIWWVLKPFEKPTVIDHAKVIKLGDQEALDKLLKD